MLSTTKMEHVATLAVGLLLAAVALAEVGVAVRALLLAEHAPPDESYPSFLVVGDWGRQGRHNQSVVAAAMARTAAARHLPLSFVVSTGDNFYESGLSSAEDPQFAESFADVYWQPSLQVPWHAVLGNHDYGEVWDGRRPTCPEGSRGRDQCFWGPVHQLEHRLTERDARWHCERRFTLTLAGGDVQLFFIDTNPFLQKYHRTAWASNKGGIAEQSVAGQLAELEAELAASSARWRLVVGHHPMHTRHRRDEHSGAGLRDRIEPLLLQHGVQAYLCGHDHNLQHMLLPGSGYHQVTSGAGSEVSDSFFRDDSSPWAAPFQYGRNGYVLVSMSRDAMHIDYFGVDSDEALFSVALPPAPNPKGPAMP